MDERFKKIIACVTFAMTSFFISCGASFASDEEDPLLGVREGWAWPVVVIQPPEGWDSAPGTSIKHAMRTAEREVSLEREAIRGKEVTFMFSDISDVSELPARLKTWRAMNVSAIVTFAEARFNAALSELCRENGPSVLMSGGEEAGVYSPGGRPYKYLFALDLPYYARANAIAEAISATDPEAEAAVFTDILSAKLAHGAELSSRFLKTRGIDALNISSAAYRQDQFTPQIRELETAGVQFYVCWLDAMATLSIWQSLDRRNRDGTVFYSGTPRQILTDAEGTFLVDKDVLLERDEEGRHAIINKIRDAFDVIVDDPVISAKAYSIAKWVIEAYRVTGSGETSRIAGALEETENIPLMGEILSIDKNTHRPKSRKFGILRITGRVYESYGSVEVFSAETEESELTHPEKDGSITGGEIIDP
ncbi:MAG: ABC transporter substrate-binding protein [Synergistaceae bacterium]|jgi:hypothetical protein|nr:ABC transporter substrate-binding protein [Synergistaceae bacterium]